VNRIVPLLLLVLTLILGTIFISQRVGVNPRASCTYPAYAFSKSGFNANEMVSVWVGLSNGTYEGLPPVKSNGSGTVSFTAISKSSWPTGNVRIVAHGKNGYEAYSDSTMYTNPGCS
jgi:hypothetical protein